MILLIDNYDSFVYNLYQQIGQFEEDIKIIRNDQIKISQIQKLSPDFIVFSPGPGRPSEAGEMEAIIEAFYKDIPMLGICLGHQAICEVFGSPIDYAQEVMHGRTSQIRLEDDMLFQGMDREITVGRYHSLIVSSLSSQLKVIAVSEHDEIMAVRHKDYPIYGIQFHPESILTQQGDCIIQNFLGVKEND